MMTTLKMKKVEREHLKIRKKSWEIKTNKLFNY